MAQRGDSDPGSHRTGGRLKAGVEMGVLMIPDELPYAMHEIGAQFAIREGVAKYLGG